MTFLFGRYVSATNSGPVHDSQPHPVHRQLGVRVRLVAERQVVGNQKVAGAPLVHVLDGAAIL